MTPRYLGCLVLAAMLAAGAAPAQTPPAGAPPKSKPAKPPKAPAPAKPAPAKPAPAKPAAATAAEPASGSTIDMGAGSGPIDITSDNGIEMQQSNKVYIATGNAIAKRGDRTLYGDTLMAYYRDIANSSDTEIWRVVADGHVRLTTPTQSVEGDHGVYDLDTKIATMTGKHLKLTTPQDVVTARDSMEWYDDKQFAIARGNAVGIRGDRQIRGDVLTAQVSTAQGEGSRISLVNADGHVIASRPDEIGTGDKGVYNVDTGVVTLSHHVTLAKGENTLVGEYGVLDMEKGVSRMLPRPPNASAGYSRVQGYIVPKKHGQPDAGDGAKPGDTGRSSVELKAAPPPPGATAQAAPGDAAQKAQPDATKAR